jgi:hypothetical protein
MSWVGSSSRVVSFRSGVKMVTHARTSLCHRLVWVLAGVVESRALLAFSVARVMAELAIAVSMSECDQSIGAGLCLVWAGVLWLMSSRDRRL